MPRKKITAAPPEGPVVAAAPKVRRPRKTTAKAVVPVTAPVAVDPTLVVVTDAVPTVVVVAAPKVRRPRPPEQDSVETLVKKISESLPGITGHDAFKDAAWDRMRKAEKDQNRKELIRIIGQASALKRRLFAIRDVTSAWQAATAAASAFVAAENKLGRHGQKQFDAGMRDEFVAMDARIGALSWAKDGELAGLMTAVLDDLADLTFRTENYVWPHGFCRCGVPLTETTLKDGKKKVFPRCKACFSEAKASITSLDEMPEKVIRRVKKPGSASRRGLGKGPKGRRKGDKGK
jgi:hypothetical protein